MTRQKFEDGQIAPPISRDVEMFADTTSTPCYLEYTYNVDKTIYKIDGWADETKLEKNFAVVYDYNPNKTVDNITTYIYSNGILDYTTTDIFTYSVDKSLLSATRTIT